MAKVYNVPTNAHLFKVMKWKENVSDGCLQCTLIHNLLPAYLLYTTRAFTWDSLTYSSEKFQECFTHAKPDTTVTCKYVRTHVVPISVVNCNTVKTSVCSCTVTCSIIREVVVTTKFHVIVMWEVLQAFPCIATIFVVGIPNVWRTIEKVLP